MDSNMLITFLLFLSINIVIYVALFRWASQINEIVKNLESINDKLDVLIGVNFKSQGQEESIEIDDNIRLNH
jgi:predicted PurR-regulated permease PerM